MPRAHAADTGGIFFGIPFPNRRPALPLVGGHVAVGDAVFLPTKVAWASRAGLAVADERTAVFAGCDPQGPDSGSEQFNYPVQQAPNPD